MRQKTALSLVLVPVFAAASTLLAFGQHTGHEITSVDRQFVAQAMQGNEQEIASAKTESTSSDPAVRSFARMVYQDHEKAAVHLEALAKQYNLRYPEAVSSAPKALPARQYMQNEVTDHQKAIALYEDEIKHGSNTSIKQYAIATLPTLKKHLAAAQQYVASRH